MNLTRAITAGIIGGITVDAFLVAIHVAPFPGIYQFIASTVAGPVAYTSGSYIWLGLAMHFSLSIGFALAYAFVAGRSLAVAKNPTLWGAIFGFVVMLIMQVVTGIAHASPPPTVSGFIGGFVAHVVFFGLPVAWYIALANRRVAQAV